MAKINIAGIDKAVLVKALYDRARPLGMGMIHDMMNPPLTLEQIRELLPTPKALDYPAAGSIPGFQKPMDFDYLQGRVMKVNVAGDEMETWAYNRDNGDNAAEQVVAALRSEMERQELPNVA